MKYILLFFLLFNYIFAQVENNGVDLDLLRAPNSPAFLLLGLSDENIHRPTSITDFQISINEASNNYSLIPKNFGVEIAPYWLFAKKETLQNLSFQRFAQEEAPLQTFTFSVATSSYKDSVANVENRKLSFGLKISICRGRIDPKGNFAEINKKLRELTDDYSSKFEEYRGKDITYLKYKDSIKTALNRRNELDSLYRALTFKKFSLEKDINTKLEELDILNYEIKHTELLIGSLDIRVGGLFNSIDELDAVLKEKVLNSIEEVKKEAEEVEFKRYGFKLDLASGFALEFPTNEIGYSRFHKLAGWITTGYDWDNDLGLFVTGRLSKGHTKDSLGANIYPLNIDFGAKFVIDNLVKKFAVSGEVLGKKYLNKEDEDFKWRFSINMSYELFANKLLTFNIGKEFDKKVETGGNLIAALNLILGFGSNRPIF